MKHLLYILLILLVSFPAAAQDDLLKMLEEEKEEETVHTIATFKSTRIINGHSVETVGAGVLEFRISHRFGMLNSGAYDFFGLDQATIRLGLEYGITDRLTLGVGRSSIEKTYDGFGKYRLLWQSTGKKTMPLSLDLFSSIAVKTERWADPNRNNFFTSRLYYTHQVIVGKKFNDKFSMQVSPTLVHRNLVETTEDENDVFALGVGGRYLLSRSVSLNAEYFYLLSPTIAGKQNNSLSVGFDIETGGHVFQLHFTNSRGMIEKMFITETNGNWLNGDIHFGFNISRVFTINRNAGREK